MENKLVIKFGNNQIIAEVSSLNGPEIPPELYVSIKNAHGIEQNLCVIRPYYEWNEDGDSEISDDRVDCLVWGDPEFEDYTDKHVIGVYKEEEV